MSQGHRGAFASLIAVLLIGLAAPAHAARFHHKVRTQPDLLRDFGAMAQNRPRVCSAKAPAQPPDWKLEHDECAWQELLRVRSWSGVDGAGANKCVSIQAQWWAWSQPAGQSHAWQAAWTGQARRDDSGAVKRIVVLQRAAGGQWNATEWRWTPSARAATRAWQQGRWDLLAARADKLRQPAVAGAAARETQMLQSAWEKNLGPRAGEISGDAWRWGGDGVCLRTAAVGAGPQQFHLPYAAEDGRHEQRAAMQLQLARRYPKATWPTPFALLPAAPQTRGGAKFDAVWVEGAEVSGQLWIPTRGDGPVVRLRIATTLASGQPAAVAQAAQAVGRELAGIAARWSELHE